MGAFGGKIGVGEDVRVVGASLVRERWWRRELGRWNGMEREIGMMEERVKSGKSKTGISGLRPWKREEDGFPVVERERIVGEGAGEKRNCAVSRGGRGGRDESENGESGFSGMGDGGILGTRKVGR